MNILSCREDETTCNSLLECLDLIFSDSNNLDHFLEYLAESCNSFDTNVVTAPQWAGF